MRMSSSSTILAGLLLWQWIETACAKGGKSSRMAMDEGALQGLLLAAGILLTCTCCCLCYWYFGMGLTPTEAPADTQASKQRTRREHRVKQQAMGAKEVGLQVKADNVVPSAAKRSEEKEKNDVELGIASEATTAAAENGTGSFSTVTASRQTDFTI
mmetsp:Transcript_3210/g.7176  ORF Transcript_3210/g.7176 Transcript_3210/m.7176 type:complete len:157 (+) Transcript_3210:138-608(+)